MENTDSKIVADALTKAISAVNFAAIKHTNQRRKNKEAAPYINHPIGVAFILINEGHVYDVETIQAAILHDTVEDTDATFEELEINFGTNVMKIVSEVTDDKSLPKEQRKLLQISHAPQMSNQAKLVKMADKIYNLRDLSNLPPQSWYKIKLFRVDKLGTQFAFKDILCGQKKFWMESKE